MNLKKKLGSTRFFYIQEGIVIGVLAAIAKTLWISFPLIELYSFMGPVIGVAFGFKSWGDFKEIQARNGNTEGTELPIREEAQ